MNLKRTAAVSLSAAALVLGGAGVSHAGDGPKFYNDTQILPCPNLEIVNIPILSADINNLDCSRNHKSDYRYESYEYNVKHRDRHHGGKYGKHDDYDKRNDRHGDYDKRDDRHDDYDKRDDRHDDYNKHEDRDRDYNKHEDYAKDNDKHEDYNKHEDNDKHNGDEKDHGYED